jgi:hypothetical protein
VPVSGYDDPLAKNAGHLSGAYKGSPASVWTAKSTKADPTPNSPIPAIVDFDEANGGEWRKVCQCLPLSSVTCKAAIVVVPQRIHITFLSQLLCFCFAGGFSSSKSFHGYPHGYAQLIEGPIGFRIEPMQIDTRNRDGSMETAAGK